MTGTLNTVFAYSIYCFLVYCELDIWLALLFSTVVGVLFNFFTLSSFVFYQKGSSVFFKFISVYAVVYLLHAVLLNNINTVVDNAFVSGIILVFPMALLTYYLMKHVVFVKSGTDPHANP